MNDFQPIFDYIDKSNQDLKKVVVSEVREELSDVKTAIANLSSQVKKYHEEMMVSGHRIDQLEDWANRVGQKIGVPINF
ncbi:MAG: hypothetical protein WC794_02895 [Candidatus Doudnabacteria bacterium]|jgi:uncharacterized coiled-coil DUF342 family protein